MVFGKDPVRLGMQIAFGRVHRKTAPTMNSDRQSAVNGNSLDGDCNAVGQHPCYGAFWQEMKKRRG